MTRSSLTRITASAFAAGIASLALAGPASAMQPGDPGHGPAPVASTPASPGDSGWEVGQLAAGAAGGVALAGAGIAAAAGLRRRSAHVPA